MIVPVIKLEIILLISSSVTLTGVFCNMLSIELAQFEVELIASPVSVSIINLIFSSFCSRLFMIFGIRVLNISCFSFLVTFLSFLRFATVLKSCLNFSSFWANVFRTVILSFFSYFSSYLH